MVKSKSNPPNYNELNQELNEVVGRLEQGDLDVDEAVECYERGLEIITVLQTHILGAENRVNELKAAYDAFDNDDTDEEE